MRITSKSFVVWDSDDDMAIEFRHGDETWFVQMSEQQAAALAHKLDEITTRRYQKRQEDTDDAWNTSPHLGHSESVVDDAIHMADLTRVNRTLCGQPLGDLNVQAARPDFASGCWTCLAEDDKRPDLMRDLKESLAAKVHKHPLDSTGKDAS
jgi:hypothetical protein